MLELNLNMLSDTDILEEMKQGNITIDPFDENRLQPASYDVLLGFEFLVFDNTKTSVIDPKSNFNDYTRKIVLNSPGEYLILHPKEFVLGVSYEKVGISAKFACELMGKSSLARLGLIVHTTAGFIDPGNELKITLEMVNFNTVPLKLYPKMKIAQVAFTQLRTPAKKPYGHPDLGNKYYKSDTVEASQMHKNFTSE
jgi:dCTP deaminase